MSTKQAYDEAKKAAIEEAKRILAMLESSECQSPNWSNVGDMARIQSQLVEVHG